MQSGPGLVAVVPYTDLPVSGSAPLIPVSGLVLLCPHWVKGKLLETRMGPSPMWESLLRCSSHDPAYSEEPLAAAKTAPAGRASSTHCSGGSGSVHAVLLAKRLSHGCSVTCPQRTGLPCSQASPAGNQALSRHPELLRSWVGEPFQGPAANQRKGG